MEQIKCVSFSLFGTHAKYLIGALKNVDLATLLLPDYKCYFFYDNSVPVHIIEQLSGKTNTKVFDMTGSTIPPTMWRFLAIDFPEVQLMLSRDTDSRLNKREISIVREWENDATDFMVIKDHPGSHGTYAMFAGLWAMKKKANLTMSALIDGWAASKTDEELHQRTADQDFLSERILPLTVNNMAYYDDFNINKTDTCRKIAHQRENWRFIGEIFDENDIPEYHWKALRGYYWRSKGLLGYCFAKAYSLFVPEWR